MVKSIPTALGSSEPMCWSDARRIAHIRSRLQLGARCVENPVLERGESTSFWPWNHSRSVRLTMIFFLALLNKLWWWLCVCRTEDRMLMTARFRGRHGFLSNFEYLGVKATFSNTWMKIGFLRRASGVMLTTTPGATPFNFAPEPLNSARFG